MNKEQYSYLDIDFAMRYLSKLLQDIVPTGSVTSFVLPCFEQYRAICIKGRIVTIISKNRTSYNDKKSKYRQHMSI